MSSNQNTQKKSNNIYKYYKTIDFLPLFNFFMVYKSQDLRYLLKLEDYETLPDYTEIDQLQKVWESILIEFQEAEDNNSSIIQFVDGKTILNLEVDYLILWNIHNLMETIPESKEVEQLKKEAGIKGKDIKYIEKQLKILNNKIRLKRKNLKDDEPKNKEFDFYRLIDEIEDIKGGGYILDIHKTTVRKYIAIKKNIKAKHERQNHTTRRNR